MKNFFVIQYIWLYERGVEQTDVVLIEEYMLRLAEKNYLLYKVSDFTGKLLYIQLSL